jgi:glutamate dehydrogenase (NAD(P)+)
LLGGAGGVALMMDRHPPIYADPAFDMAREQFRLIADYLNIDTNDRDRLLMPKRAVVVSLPIHRDDGSVSVYTGYRVQHHLTIGPTKGGTRFSADVNLGEIAALSIWMSWKCALAGLPYGGAKGGITVNPRDLSLRELETLSRRYMQEMIPFIGPHTDIMGPDMGTNEQIMAWFMDTYSVYMGRSVNEIVTGKPVFLGGSAGRRESTGRGVAFLVERALEVLKVKAAGCTAIVQGFGNVGSVAAASLYYKAGVKIVGLSDAYAAYYEPRGIDLKSVDAHLAKNPDLSGFKGADRIDPEEMLVQPCDILIPAAVDRVIHGKNAGRLQCRVLAEAANGPTSPEADVILDQRRDEILVIPDILCNAGGVIVSYFEWVQDLQNFFWNESEIADRLFRILETAFSAVMKRARTENISHRQAALAIAVERVLKAKQTRGLFP